MSASTLMPMTFSRPTLWGHSYNPDATRVALNRSVQTRNTQRREYCPKGQSKSPRVLVMMGTVTQVPTLTTNADQFPQVDPITHLIRRPAITAQGSGSLGRRARGADPGRSLMSGYSLRSADSVGLHGTRYFQDPAQNGLHGSGGQSVNALPRGMTQRPRIAGMPRNRVSHTVNGPRAMTQKPRPLGITKGGLGPSDEDTELKMEALERARADFKQKMDEGDEEALKLVRAVAKEKMDEREEALKLAAVERDGSEGGHPSVASSVSSGGDERDGGMGTSGCERMTSGSETPADEILDPPAARSPARRTSEEERRGLRVDNSDLLTSGRDRSMEGKLMTGKRTLQREQLSPSRLKADTHEESLPRLKADTREEGLPCLNLTKRNGTNIVNHH